MKLFPDMETKDIGGGIKLLFPSEERETANIVEKTCKRCISLIDDMWGLPSPDGCRLYVMTSFLQFVFLPAPWYARIYFALTLPFWFFKVRKMWKTCGGWTHQHRKSVVIGVKPARLLDRPDTSVGKPIFNKEDDLNTIVEHIVCHEMTHAFSLHLKLPLWINEGIAMATVDEFMGKPTVRIDSLEYLQPSPQRRRMVNYRQLPEAGKEEIVYSYVRSYWIIRFLVAVRPGFLQTVLKKGLPYRELEKEFAAAFNTDCAGFWRDINRNIVEYFGGFPSGREAFDDQVRASVEVNELA